MIDSQGFEKLAREAAGKLAGCGCLVVVSFLAGLAVCLLVFPRY